MRVSQTDRVLVNRVVPFVMVIMMLLSVSQGDQIVPESIGKVDCLLNLQVIDWIVILQ